MHILLRIAEYLKNYLGLYFQQDNALGHTTSFTKEDFESISIKPI